MNSDITIRQAAGDDLPVVYTFICALEDRQLPFGQFASVFRENLANGTILYLIASCGTADIGFISCHGQMLLHHCGMVYEVQELFVLPEYRQSGIATMLMRSVEQMIAEKEYMLLEVACNRKRETAHAFYEANGFVKTHFKFTKLPGG